MKQIVHFHFKKCPFSLLMGLLAVPHDCLEKLGILADVENTNNFFLFSSA